MKKLIIICEGKTEQLFCKNLLEDYFKKINVLIEFPLISHSNGGIVKWIHLKSQIENTLKIDSSCVVTTFIDYYGIEGHHNFPQWNVADLEIDKNRRMDILEKGMLSGIDNALGDRFIPYIQLHEFEALAFSNYQTFEDYYEDFEADFTKLKLICDNNQNPETINNSPETAPSKRLKNNIYGYDKISHGIDICEMMGLNQIILKCKRFGDWISNLKLI
jgi:hypothetical protein